jgi:putative CocE/NonD family hydrolase
VAAELHVATSLEHTDFFARVCDVHPEGRSVNVCDGLLRLRPGSGVAGKEGSRLIQVDLWPTAYRFVRGHRVRLQVSSGAHPRFSRNLGLGEPAATAMAMKASEQSVFHDAGRPSALLLPEATQRSGPVRDPT